MTVYIGEARRGVVGGAALCPVARIFLHSSVPKRSASTRAFATSVNVSKRAQKHLGESTHPISNTRSMHMMIKSSSGTNNTTLANAPTWDVYIVPWWYSSITSSLDTRTGPSYRSASQIAWRMCGQAFPNCILSGVISIFVVLLTLVVSLLGCANKFSIRGRRRWS